MISIKMKNPFTYLSNTRGLLSPSSTVQAIREVCRVSISEAAGWAFNSLGYVSPSNTSDLMLLTMNLASFLYVSLYFLSHIMRERHRFPQSHTVFPRICCPVAGGAKQALSTQRESWYYICLYLW